MGYRYAAMLSINGDLITDEGRGPIEETLEERSVDVMLASGRKKKYIKDIVKNFSISWENVASNSSKTADGAGGRDEIRALAYSGVPLTLIIQDGQNSPETYSVWVNSYSETLTLRRQDNLRYKVELKLDEVGG